MAYGIGYKTSMKLVRDSYLTFGVKVEGLDGGGFREFIVTGPMISISRSLAFTSKYLKI